MPNSIRSWRPDTTKRSIQFDFGDAPQPYPTLGAFDGASHGLRAYGPWMGAAVDGEADGVPSQAADGDDRAGLDDEDGTFLTPLTPAQQAEVEIDMSSSPIGGVVNAWVDFDANGVLTKKLVVRRAASV